MEALDKQQIRENRVRCFLEGAEYCYGRKLRDEDPPEDLHQFPGNEKHQHRKMEGVQPSQPQEKKPPYAEAVEQSLLVIRGDDKTAQHKKEIDEEPGVAQERHAVQMAVGVQMEQCHQACGDTAPTVQYHESFHVRPERLTMTAPHS